MTRIAVVDARVLVVRDRDAGAEPTVDDPLALRFRRPLSELPQAAELHDVVELPAGELDDWSGWYADGNRRLLLTQSPEGQLGEPMVLIGEADRVLRAYPLGDGAFLRADGVRVSLDPGSVGAAIRIGNTPLRRDRGYEERRIELAAGGAVTLSATLIIPPGRAPHPAAVFLHGAAGGQRDFNRLLIGPVLDAGIAVLIYDKQGFGKSTGTPPPTTFDQAAAAEVALDRLAGEPGFDPDRLGIVAFSNGGWAMPMAARRRTDIAFLAGIGVPGVSMADAEVHRRTKVLRDSGLSPVTVDAAAAAWRSIFTAVGSGTADGQVIAELSDALGRLRAAEDLDRYPIPGYARQNPMLSAVPPLLPIDQLLAMLPSEPDEELTYDPVPDHAQLTCPVMLQWGEHDTSVPVAQSAERVSQARPDALLRVYPGVEHMLNVAITDVEGISPEEAMYGFHGFRFASAARVELTDVLRQVTGQTGPVTT